MNVLTVSISVALLLMLIDVAVGLIGSLLDGTFKSSVMREGLMHKFTEIAVIAVSALIQWLSAYGLALVGGDALGVYTDVPICVAVTAYVALMEAGSILEHCVHYNPGLGDMPFFKAFANKQDK